MPGWIVSAGNSSDWRQTGHMPRIQIVVRVEIRIVLDIAKGRACDTISYLITYPLRALISPDTPARHYLHLLQPLTLLGL